MFVYFRVCVECCLFHAYMCVRLRMFDFVCMSELVCVCLCMIVYVCFLLRIIVHDCVLLYYSERCCVFVCAVCGCVWLCLFICV